MLKNQMSRLHQFYNNRIPSDNTSISNSENKTREKKQQHTRTHTYKNGMLYVGEQEQ